MVDTCDTAIKDIGRKFRARVLLKDCVTLVRHRVHRVFILCFAVWASCRLPVSLAEETDCALEYRVKAAFIYNFSNYVDWPAGTFLESDGAFIIGVMADEPVVNVFEENLKAKTVDDRRVLVKHFAGWEGVSECQALFVAANRSVGLAESLAQLAKAPVLTVGEVDKFLDAGGMINFKTVDGRIRFEINRDAAEAAGLQISSQLLKLATSVRSSRRGAGE